MRLSKRVSLQTQFRIEQVLFKSFYFFCRSIPSSWVLGLGRRIGRLAWKLKARRNTVIKNLRIAFKDKYSNQELDKIAVGCFEHFGREMMRVLILDKEAKKPLESWIDVEGQDVLKDREKAGGILVGGHLGCWEIANLVMPKIGEDVTVFTGTHANKTADKWLNQIRRRAGTKTAGSQDDRTELYNAAKEGLVAIVGDQSPSKAPIWIDFFDRETDAAQGPALLSLLNRVDYFYFSCLKNGDRMKIRFRKVEFEKAETRKENVQRLTQAYFNILQEEIEAHPEQYFWMHKRWKKCKGVDYGEKEALF